MKQHGLKTAWPGIVSGLLLIWMFAQPAMAEPYFAVRTGLKCGTCHVNPTGGGLRTAYGNQWARTELAASTLENGGDAWMGRVSEHFAVGGNLRGSARHVDIPDSDAQSDFALEEMRLYLEFSPIPNRLGVVIDQNLAPGGSINREAYLRYWSGSQEWYVKGGQLYLPYGLRLEDDTAFIRQAPGINMTTPDRGIEIGWEKGNWSSQLAVTNGTAGAAEIDTGKQLSLRSEHVQGGWRLGASVNVNDTDAGTREMMNVFAGLRTGPVYWLAEIDRISDESIAGEPEGNAALLEANWQFLQGHNLKLTGEYLDPDSDVDEDERNRVSLVWEYTPIPFMQVRAGARAHDGPEAIDLQNRTELFLQWHGFY
jgi:hypothetical protein